MYVFMYVYVVSYLLHFVKALSKMGELGRDVRNITFTSVYRTRTLDAMHGNITYINHYTHLIVSFIRSNRQRSSDFIFTGSWRFN